MVRKLLMRVLAVLAALDLVFIPAVEAWDIWGLIYGIVILATAALIFASSFSKRRWPAVMSALLGAAGSVGLMTALAVENGAGNLFDDSERLLIPGAWAALCIYLLALLCAICLPKKRGKNKKDTKKAASVFCPRCGTKLTEKAVFCKNCGYRLSPPEDDGQDKKNIPIKKGRGTGKKATAVFILVLFLLSGFGLAASTGVIEVPFLADLGKEDLDQTEFGQLTGKFSNVRVTDGDSAILAAQDAAGILGLENAADELTVKNITSTDAGNFYRLQQMYQGIPVYGRTFVVAADADGNTRSLTFNASDMSGLATEPSVTQEQAEAGIREYIRDNYSEINADELETGELSEEKLAVYNLDDKENPVLVYVLNVSADGASAEVLVNAQSGEVVLFNGLVESLQTEFTYPGQIEGEEKTFIAEKTDQGNSMVYESRTGTRITVNIPLDGHDYDWYYDENHSVVTWKDGEEPDRSAVDAMTNITAAYNFYLTNFSRDSFTGEGEDVNVYVHASGLKMWDGSTTERSDNAFYWPSPNGSVIAFNPCYDENGNLINEFSTEIDAATHEYTHGVVRYTSTLSNMNTNDMPSGINEAFSDIMGYCVEAETQRTEENPEPRMDWKSVVRCSYPGGENSSGQAYHVRDYYQGMGEHQSSTIISYAAYLMNTGIKGKGERLTNDEIADLWYTANLIFPSDCTFNTVRECVTAAGKILLLSDSKMECIYAAFDKVGIKGREETKATYSTETELTVFDREGMRYDDYTVNISGKQKSGFLGLFRKDYSREIEADSEDPVMLDLPEGEYTITLKDNADSERTVEKSAEVRKNGKNTELEVQTNFGMDYTVSDSARMSVYDINSVLYGDYTVNITGVRNNEQGNPENYTDSMEVTNPEPVWLGLTEGKYTIELRDRLDPAKTKTVTVRVREQALSGEIKVQTDFGQRAGAFDPANVPAGAAEKDGHYYYIYRFEGDVNSWDDAEEFCETKGGYLATATSQQENEFLFSLLSANNYGSAFFGLTDPGDGNWKWENDERFGYTDWAPGEPGFSGGRYGIISQDKNGEWSTSDFSYGMDLSGIGFICEWGEFERADAEITVTGTRRTTSDERDIVVVLDKSGSMDGEPMDETIEATQKFISTVLEEDASIGVVAYSDQAGVVNDFSMNADVLHTSVDAVSSGGGTNMEDGLATAYEMLRSSNAEKRIIVLMSDGMPNAGKVGEELTQYAEQLRQEDIYIYTLGFFSSLDDGQRAEAQSLLEGIASEGCHYEVDSAENLVFFFHDIADQINGQKYIYIRIACPVDVKVTYNGETLDSDGDSLNTRTDFGTLSFEEPEEGEPGDTPDTQEQGTEEDNRIKILRLKDGVKYDVQIDGTGKGRMDYTIGFMDDSGEYTDFREFEEIRITEDTKIDTVADSEKDTVLNVDEDGDGRYDLRYRAGINEKGKIVDHTFVIYIAAGAAGVVIILIMVLAVRMRKKHRDTMK